MPRPIGRAYWHGRPGRTTELVRDFLGPFASFEGMAARSLPVVGAPLAPPRAAPRSVRISLTDRCDMACVYCRPSRTDGYLEKRLDEDAWRAMVRALVQAGVRRVR